MPIFECRKLKWCESHCWFLHLFRTHKAADVHYEAVLQSILMTQGGAALTQQLTRGREPLSFGNLLWLREQLCEQLFIFGMTANWNNKSEYSDPNCIFLANCVRWRIIFCSSKNKQGKIISFYLLYSPYCYKLFPPNWKSDAFCA